MDTVLFFRKILPTRGVYFLMEDVSKPDHPKGGYKIHFPFGPEQIEEMADKALQMSDNGHDIYFACSSFKEVQYKTSAAGREYPTGRTQSNASFAKSMWVDVDVGKPDPEKCYPTQREAAAAMSHLCKEVGLPAPMMVSSGKGLHFYWPLTEEVDSDRWLGVASQLKSVCAHLGVKADPSRTADPASVLRPVGTLNYKYGEPKIVKVLKDADAVPIGVIAAALADYIIAHQVKHTRRDSPSKPSLNAALIGEPIEYPPAYADQIVKHCGVMRHFHDKLGNVSEPFWYAAIGVLKHCEDGDNIAQKWSSGHPDYDRDGTQQKLDQWSYGPSSCEKLASESGLKLCESCPHNGKVKSPIQLGHLAPVAQEVKVEVSKSEDVEPEKVLLPDGYSWLNGMMRRAVADKDGVIDHVPFSDTLFLPVSRVRDEDGTWNLRIKMNVAGHYWREFDLPQMLIPDPRGLARHLAKYEIIIFGIKHAMEYMKDYAAWMRERGHEITTYDRFGWDEGKFIVGKTAFLPNGSTEEVLLSENVLNSKKNIDCTPVGDLDTWVELINLAYNRPKAEKYQFVIAAAFAAPLVPLANFQNYRGIPVVLSGEGGIGKSSVCKAASTIYADPNALLIDATQKNGSTLQGLVGLASMFNGVPVLFDEMTERDPKEFTPLMYSLSNGQGKIRMTSGGKFAETAAPFCGIYFGTSNNDVTDMIYREEKKSISDAAAARCFEIGGLCKSEMMQVFEGVDMKDLLEHKLFHHHGLAAQVYLPYVVKNREAIIRALVTTRNKLGSDVHSDSRERFYIDTIAFAHVAATIAVRLGLIKWDVNATTKWALKHLKNLRRNFVERTALVEDNVSLFLSWLHGRTIVTRNFPKRRPKQDEMEVVSEPIRYLPSARVATKDRVMLVAISALHEWCKEHKQIPEEFRKQLAVESYVIGEHVEFLGKGTNIITGRSRCLELNYDKVVGSLYNISAKLADDVSDYKEAAQ